MTGNMEELKVITPKRLDLIPIERESLKEVHKRSREIRHKRRERDVAVQRLTIVTIASLLFNIVQAVLICIQSGMMQSTIP